MPHCLGCTVLGLRWSFQVPFYRVDGFLTRLDLGRAVKGFDSGVPL